MQVPYICANTNNNVIRVCGPYRLSLELPGPSRKTGEAESTFAHNYLQCFKGNKITRMLVIL